MTNGKTYKPEWAEGKEDNEAFTSSVKPGVVGGHDGLEYEFQEKKEGQTRRQDLSVDDYINGVLAGDRMLLARTITLIESNAVSHINKAQEVIKSLLPHTGKSIRIGISGVPGAGKSTFIEAFGTYLCDRGHKVAVLAVDPSSTVSRGSILGDKTRMERLSQHKNSFIRPSPSGGVLGGVGRKTRETILVCEASGYDVILVETVGVGQSEATVRQMVDFFILLMITGAGDELQSIKKGIIELSDAILVNKADGDNLLAAKRTQSDINQALHYLKSFTEGWETKAYTVSALTGDGIEDIWEVTKKFKGQTEEAGVFYGRRQKQLLDWVDSMLFDQLNQCFLSSESVKQIYPEIKDSVTSGRLPATKAVEMLIEAFRGRE